MDKKLNNLIYFKEFGKLDKLENKPGKIVVEGLNNIQSFDNYNESWADIKKVGRKIGTATGILDKNQEEILLKSKEILNDNKRMRQIKSAIENYQNPKFKNDYDTLERQGGDLFAKYIVYLDDHYYQIRDNTSFYQFFNVKTGEVVDSGSYGSSHSL